MKISQLIQALQEIYNLHGDVPVATWDRRSYVPVNNAYYTEADDTYIMEKDMKTLNEGTFASIE